MGQQQVEKTKHLHTYQRITKGYGVKPGLIGFFRCIDAHCSHYSQRSLLVGKAALCIYCGREYKLTIPKLKLKNPHCDECTRLGYGTTKPKDRVLNVIDHAMDKLFGGQDSNAKG